MDFEVSDDRRMLADTLRRFLAAEYPIEARNRVAYEAPFHDPERWRALGELGVLQALVDEDAGGFGGAGFDITTVFEELGRALCPEPVLGALMGMRLLAAAGEAVAPVLSGQTRVAVATGELDAQWALDEIETEAVETDGGWALAGRKSVIYGGQAADRLLVAARAGNDLALFEVAPQAASLTAYGLIDGGGAADAFLERTPARLVLRDAADALADALDAGALALCAEAVGAMDVCLETLLEYLKMRNQFGKPIGAFQAIQHRAVDLTIEIEQARSITILAASRMDGPQQSHTVAMAKHLAGRVGKLVAEETIQLHGGIAMTWEYPISHYAKRLVMIDHQLGDSDHHLHKVMERQRA